MSTIDPIEISAATVEEAVQRALDQLGAREDDVVIEVLATPRAGVLGLGARQARVRVTHRAGAAATSGMQSPPLAPPVKRDHAEPRRPRRAPQASAERATQEVDRAEPQGPAREAVDLGQEAQEATGVLTQILELMGEKAEVVTAESDDAESVELEIKGDGSGILIGRHGQTLDALEYIVNRIVARRIREAVPVVLETESYRARRRQQLHRMALSMGERAKRDHDPVMLDPMPPRDRRVVHLALKDDPMLTTRSSGDGFLRSIEIVPVGGGPRRERERGSEQRSRHRERPEPPEPIGEQGGFKHGQKRIV
ncbi:MAG TPA: RNA-binding cell elongation regulator Jag/EloR [Candidatus Binataceae bacterium]|nr:RNA-binding cell elongation regulator Jag/EloR [Candidatus Binataceae bacterium]